MSDELQGSSSLESVVLMADPVIGSIPISESGEALIPIEPTPKLSLEPTFREVDPRCVYVRTSVAESLYRAAESLPDGVEVRFYEGWRSRETQAQYFREFLDALRSIYPKTTVKQLQRLASRYVSPPWIAPPHVTGSAIDLTLGYINGPELDMGTKVNETPEDSEDRCYTYSEDISKEARKNRELLIRVLTSQGFANYPTEWWHWSKGDRYWAHTYRYEKARFGEIEPTGPSSSISFFPA